MLTHADAALLEALLDPRLGPGFLPSGTGPRLSEAAADSLLPFTSERPIEWATQTLAQGEILAAFATHCRDELDDVEVLEQTSTALVARWRRETSRLELRAGFVGVERLGGGDPTMLLASLDAGNADELAERLAGDPVLRASLAVYDLARLEKVGAVRSSVFVYFEWFLRDAYGVKLLTSAAFTQSLIARGLISLGFG